jgi:hypothetical protein
LIENPGDFEKAAAGSRQTSQKKAGYQGTAEDTRQTADKPDQFFRPGPESRSGKIKGKNEKKKENQRHAILKK